MSQCNTDALRREKRRMRAALTAERAAELSGEIHKRLFSLPEWNKSGSIMTYVSAFGEPDTMSVISAAFDTGKRVAVPVSDTDTFTITPCILESLSELSPGAYGILEPEKIRPADKNTLDLVIVPGTAFSRSGARVGFGKGYYDRFLKDTRAVKCALCYDFQLSEDISPNPWDIPMDIIITEKELIYCGNAAKML